MTPTDDQKPKDTTEADSSAGVSCAAAAAAGYVVRFYVRGHLAGEIPHETAAAAYKDAQERREKFGALGCAYFVRPHTVSGEVCIEVCAESSLIDTICKPVCATCHGTRQIQTIEWPALYDVCPDCQNVEDQEREEKTL